MDMYKDLYRMWEHDYAVAFACSFSSGAPCPFGRESTSFGSLTLLLALHQCARA